MNWKEFKEYIESEGVTDDMEIGRVSLMGNKLSDYPPRARILTVGKNKIVIID